MKKILVHENKNDPVYIAVSIEAMFHIVYRDKSIGSAVSSAIKTFSFVDSRGFLDWRVIA